MIHLNISDTNSEQILSSNNYYELLFIEHGIKQISINNNTVSYNSGELLFIRKDRKYYFKNITRNNKYSEYQILLTYEELHTILNSFSNNILDRNHPYTITAGSQESIISQQLDKNLQSYFNSLEFIITSNINNHLEFAKKTELIYLLFHSDIKYIIKNIIYDLKLPKNNIINIVNSNIFNDIKLSELAIKCKLSLSIFKKEFVEHYNTPPHKWIVLQRLNRAKDLLDSTNFDVGEIAKQCCFNNTSHFIKLFKNQFNTTPLKYRNREYNNQ